MGVGGAQDPNECHGLANAEARAAGVAGTGTAAGAATDAATGAGTCPLDRDGESIHVDEKGERLSERGALGRCGFVKRSGGNGYRYR